MQGERRVVHGGERAARRLDRLDRAPRRLLHLDVQLHVEAALAAREQLDAGVAPPQPDEPGVVQVARRDRRAVGRRHDPNSARTASCSTSRLSVLNSRWLDRTKPRCGVFPVERRRAALEADERAVARARPLPFIPADAPAPRADAAAPPLRLLARAEVVARHVARERPDRRPGSRSSAPRRPPPASARDRRRLVRAPRRARQQRSGAPAGAAAAARIAQLSRAGRATAVATFAQPASRRAAQAPVAVNSRDGRNCVNARV